MSQVFCQHFDSAYTVLSQPHTVGSGTLVVADGSVFGTPTTGSPVRVTCLHPTNGQRVHFLITARDTNTLTIGSVEEYADIALPKNSRVQNRVVAKDLRDIQDAINAISTDSSLAIGQAVTGGNPNSLLFLDTNGNVANDTTLVWQGNAKLGVGVSTPGAKLHVKPSQASTTGMILQGAASQTGNLLECQYSDGTSPTYIDKDGVIVQDASINTTTFFQRYYSADPLLAAPFLTTMSHHPNGDPETPPGAPETSSFRIGYNCHGQDGVAYNPDEKTYYDFWEINYQEGGSWMCERHICASTRPDRPEEGQIRPITLHTTFDIGKPSDVVVQFNSSQINWNLEDTTPIGGFNHDDVSGNMTFFMKTGGDDSFFFNSTTGAGAFDSLSIGRTTSTSGSLALNGSASNITGGGQLSIHGTTSLSLLAPGNVGYISIDANNIIVAAPAAAGLLLSSGIQTVNFYQATIYPDNNNTVSLGVSTNQWSQVFAGKTVVQISGPTVVGSTVKGAASQTANLQEWQDSSGVVKASVSPSGKFSGDGSGLTGVTGSQGPQGPQGFQGSTGTQGSTGSQGPQGYQGFQGAVGVQGSTGSQGPQGYQGTTGPQGFQGFQGSTGTQGPQGYQGATPTSISANNVTGDLGTATDGATITFDMSTHHDWIAVLGGNRTLAVSNATVGGKYSVILDQGTGGFTVTWFSGIRWVNGTEPTLSIDANKRDVFTFWCTATGEYMGFVAGQNI
jgi:hypothetical protein